MNNENKRTEEIFWVEFTHSFEQVKERYLLKLQKSLEEDDSTVSLQKLSFLGDISIFFDKQHKYFKDSLKESSLFITILVILVFLLALGLSSFSRLNPFAPKIFSTALALTKLLTNTVRVKNNANIVENSSIIKNLFSYLPEDWRGNLESKYKRLLRKKASKRKIRCELFKMFLGMFWGTLRSKIEDIGLSKRYIDD